MKLLVEGNEVPLAGLVIYESLDQLYTTLELTTNYYINVSKVKLEWDKSLECMILRSVYENQVYRYTLVSQDTWDLMNANCQEFSGSADVKKLLSSIGINAVEGSKTDTTDWILPSLKFSAVITYLNRYASVQSGGAPRFYIDIDGTLRFVDLKKAYDANAIELTGSVDRDTSERDWLVKFPGKVKLYVESNDGIEVQDIDVGPGSGTYRINDTTGFSASMVAQRLRNEPQYNAYSARKLVVSVPSAKSLELGDTVKVDGTDEKFIIHSRTTSIPVSDESPVIKLILCAPCQKL